jgi:3-oxoacyl-[acyl-carrier protein] reductase
MDLGISGSTALVLGAGGGLGSAIAKRLAQEGVCPGPGGATHALFEAMSTFGT